MITDIFPTGMRSAGNNLAIWLKTPPADPAKPTIAELQAGFDVTCYLPADFWDGLGFGQERDDDTRACDESKREEFGVETWDLKEITHIVDPQGKGTEPGNLARGEIVANSMGYLYLRSGVKQLTPLEAGQTINNGFTVTTGSEATLPRTSGKYIRNVQVSLSRIMHDYVLAAA